MAIRVTLSRYCPQGSFGAAAASLGRAKVPTETSGAILARVFLKIGPGACLKSVIPTLVPCYEPLSNLLLATYIPCQKLVKATDGRVLWQRDCARSNARGCGQGGSLERWLAYGNWKGHHLNLGFDNHKWYALQVRTRWENSTSLLLSGKGYQTLLPTYKVKKSWSGKLREISAPLFPGYVFCQFDVHNRLPVLVTPGVIAVVGCGRVPVSVEDGEIAAIQTLVSSGFPAEPWPFLELGQRVRIESEPLQGLEGILINFKGNHRIVLSVSLLRRSVALEIDRSCVRPMGAARAAVLEPLGSHRLLSEVVA